MNEEMRRAAEAAAAGGGLGAVSGIFRLVIFGQAGGILAYLSIIAAATVGGSVVLLILSHVPYEDRPIPVGLQWAITIIASILAKDVLTGLRSMGDQFAVDPLALVQRVWRAIRGQ
jgi:hypothetical protein